MKTWLLLMLETKANLFISDFKIIDSPWWNSLLFFFSLIVDHFIIHCGHFLSLWFPKAIFCFSLSLSNILLQLFKKFNFQMGQISFRSMWRRQQIHCRYHDKLVYKNDYINIKGFFFIQYERLIPMKIPFFILLA